MQDGAAQGSCFVRRILGRFRKGQRPSCRVPAAPGSSSVCLSACPSVCLSAGASSCGSSVTSGRSGRPRTGCCSEGFEIQLNFGVSVARLFVSSLYFVLEKVQLLFLAARSIRSPCCEITRAALLACGLATRVELSVHAEQGWSGSTAHQTC